MSHGASAEPNMTPILDLVFQLITFFMLVSNFKSASVDMSLKLPVVGSARPVDTKGQEDLLILNIDSVGDLKIYGASKDVEVYIAGEAAGVRAAHPELKQDDELPVTVVIRADRATPFRLLNRVIKACQDHGFRKYAMRAKNKEEGA
jgi:biopolymer transport protein ExbD